MSRTTRILIGLVVGLALIAVAGIYLFKPAGDGLVTPDSFSPRRAPDFELTLYSGKKIKLSELTQERPVVINFWASWCPPCRDEAPTLAKISKEYKGKVDFVGVVVNDTEKNALAFMKEFNITYANGPDPGNIAAAYKITGIPETFWIDKEGMMIDHWIGAISEEELVKRTEKLLGR